jgi:hypothetical protein
MIDIDSWSHILSNIFKIFIIVTKDYETKNKEIGEIYTNFKENYRLPYSYYLLLNDSSLLNYYYNEDEKKMYLSRWIEKIDNNINMIPFTKIEYDFYLKISIENIYYNNFIQSDHYMDNGCLCKFCFKKRKEIIDKLKRGVKIVNEKIIHNVDLIKKEIIENSVKNSKKPQNLQNNKKIKNTLNNIVFTSSF